MLSRLTPLRAALVIWLLLSIALLIAYAPAIATLTTTDPDDALRLVQVRDLIAGQGWWDVSQHRINPAGGGGLMHWSRIVDAPLALGMAGLAPLVGAAWAERLIAALWPLLLLGAVMLVLARMAARLAVPHLGLVALLLLATDFFVLFQFTPLRVDHHGWQILLTLMALALLLRPADARSGTLAGLAAAALLAISLEGLPAAALFAALIAAEWIWTGSRPAQQRLSAYLWALTGAAVLLQFATRGPDALVQRWCDALSLPYLGALAVAATAVSLGGLIVGRPSLAAGTPNRTRDRALRAFILVLAGSASAAALIGIEPLCLKGPFGTLDPLVEAYWYSEVREGLPLWQPFDALAAFSLAPTLIGLAGCWLGWRSAVSDDAARRWLWLGVALAGLTVVSVLVLRAGSTAHVVAMPGCALIALRAWHRARTIADGRLRIVASVATMICLPPVAGAAAALLVADTTTPADSIGSTMPCVVAGHTGLLATMPPGLMLTPLDIGPGLLLHSRHAVVATGHHRNNVAMAKVIRLFTGPPDQAEALARSTGAQMILACPGTVEWQNLRDAPGEGLADLLSTGRAPAWLQPVPLGRDVPIKAWRIVAKPPTS